MQFTRKLIINHIGIIFYIYLIGLTNGSIIIKHKKTASAKASKSLSIAFVTIGESKGFVVEPVNCGLVCGLVK